MSSITCILSVTSSQPIFDRSAGGAAGAGGGGSCDTLYMRHAMYPAPAAAGMMISAGIPGSRPSSTRMPETGAQVRCELNCPPIWPCKSLGDDTRVTMAAAAIDSSNAGTWATSASPTDRLI